MNMDAIEDAEEIGDTEMPDEEPAGEENEDPSGDVQMEETTVDEEATDQTPEANEPVMVDGEVLEPPPFIANIDRGNNDLEFVREGMTPKEAMLMLIINGLIDKFAKQKALHTVEVLFKNETCMTELCKLATKFVSIPFH